MIMKLYRLLLLLIFSFFGVTMSVHSLYANNNVSEENSDHNIEGRNSKEKETYIIQLDANTPCGYERTQNNYRTTNTIRNFSSYHFFKNTNSNQETKKKAAKTIKIRFCFLSQLNENDAYLLITNRLNC